MVKSKTKNYINKLQIAFYKAGITVFDSFLIFGVFCIFYFLIKTKIRQWSYIHPPAPEGVDLNAGAGDVFLSGLYGVPMSDQTLYIVPVNFLLTFSLTLFLLSIVGLLFNRQKNVIVYMLFVELMLFSLSILSIGFSLLWLTTEGQIMALLIMAIAVSESAIGLGILIASYRLNQRIEFDNFSYLRG